MTIRKLTKSLTLLAACSALTAQAGVTPAPPAPAPPISLWTGSVTLGYDTDYIYRGLEVFGEHTRRPDEISRARHLVSGSLDLNCAVTDRLTWNFNAWYASSTASHTHYDELDLYTKLLYKVNDSFSFGPSFKYYYYPVFSDKSYDAQYEPGLEFVWVPAPDTTVNFGAFYETESDAFYIELGVNHVFKINDKVSVVPGAVISYLDRDSSPFGASASDFNHAGVYLKVPIALKSNVTLTPYIAVNFPLDAIDDIGFVNQDTKFFGGVALSVSF